MSCFCVKTIRNSSHSSQILIPTLALVLNQRISDSTNTNTKVTREPNRNNLLTGKYLPLFHPLFSCYVQMFSHVNKSWSKVQLYRLDFVCVPSDSFWKMMTQITPKPDWVSEIKPHLILRALILHQITPTINTGTRVGTVSRFHGSLDSNLTFEFFQNTD